MGKVASLKGVLSTINRKEKLKIKKSKKKFKKLPQGSVPGTVGCALTLSILHRGPPLHSEGGSRAESFGSAEWPLRGSLGERVRT